MLLNFSPPSFMVTERDTLGQMFRSVYPDFDPNKAFEAMPADVQAIRDLYCVFAACNRAGAVHIGFHSLQHGKAFSVWADNLSALYAGDYQTDKKPYPCKLAVNAYRGFLEQARTTIGLFDASLALRYLLEWLYKRAAGIQASGFSLQVSPAAPETLQGLRDNVKDGLHIVWDGASDNSVYPSKFANYVYRWVHDWEHLLFGRDTDVQGEWALWEDMQGTLLQTHLQLGAKTLLQIEHIGQVAYYQVHGKFPENQALFTVNDLLGRGLTPYNMPAHWAQHLGSYNPVAGRYRAAGQLT